MFAIDLLKFRRSYIWAVIFLVPSIAVGIGAANYHANLASLNAGWASYLSQATLFYGLIFMTVGVAIIAAAAWRLEHRNHNWHAILTSPRSAGEVVAAKFFSIMVLIALMQAVFIALALGIGCGLGIQGEISPLNLSALFLAIIPAFAVGAWQSFFSMIFRSFATPVAISLVGAIASVGILYSGIRLIPMLLPPAMVTSTISLGSTAFGADDTPDVYGIAFRMAVSICFIIAAWIASVAWLRTHDVEA